MAERKYTIDQEDLGILLVCALRYCQGRRTYMPGLVQGIAREYLREISNRDLETMMRDCEMQEKYSLYGDERIDKPGWLKWREELSREMERRKNEHTD